jgi:hypothetical protein
MGKFGSRNLLTEKEEVFESCEVVSFLGAEDELIEVVLLNHWARPLFMIRCSSLALRNDVLSKHFGQVFLMKLGNIKIHIY